MLLPPETLRSLAAPCATVGTEPGLLSCRHCLLGVSHHSWSDLSPTPQRELREGNLGFYCSQNPKLSLLSSLPLASQKEEELKIQDPCVISSMRFHRCQEDTLSFALFCSPPISGWRKFRKQILMNISVMQLSLFAEMTLSLLEPSLPPPSRII